jgi:hypothetical protein
MGQSLSDPITMATRGTVCILIPFVSNIVVKVDWAPTLKYKHFLIVLKN